MGNSMSCYLPQSSADEVQGLLGGVFADSLAVAAECALHGLGFLTVAEGDVDQADGFGFRAAGRTGDAGYTKSQSRAGALANSRGEGFSHFL